MGIYTEYHFFLLVVFLIVIRWDISRHYDVSNYSFGIEHVKFLNVNSKL